MYRQCCKSSSCSGRAGGLRNLRRDDRKGICLLWDREDLIYADKEMGWHEDSTSVLIFHISGRLGFFFSETLLAWLLLKEWLAFLFFLFLPLFTWGKLLSYKTGNWVLTCTLSFKTEIPIAVGTELGYSVALLRLWWVLHPPALSKYHFPNCISVSGAIVWQELRRIQPEPPRKARDSVVFSWHA